MSQDTLTIACGYSGKTTQIACDQLVSVTSRSPNTSLWQELHSLQDRWKEAGINNVSCIGDCHTPGLIAHAVYSGHRFAREFGMADEPIPLREDMMLQQTP